MMKTTRTTLHMDGQINHICRLSILITKDVK